MNLDVIPCGFGEAAPYLDVAMCARCDTTAGAMTLAELTEGCQFYLVRHGGEACAAFALRLQGCAGAQVAWIVAAGGKLPGHDLTATVLPAIERALLGCQIAITTRRRGLLIKLARLGYRVSGITLRKVAA